jgi:LPS-assembly protein
MWKDPDGTDYKGELKLYYAQDRHPWRGETQRLARQGHIEEERYRLQLKDRHNLTDRDYLISTVNYLSDKWLLHDFFDEEYQYNVQPENRVSLSHRADWYSAGLDLVFRLNDFFGQVNRLPEAFLDVTRVQLGSSPFYYEGKSTASYLQRQYAKGSTLSDYDLFRLDTRHMLYLPTRSFGFLSVVPRGGYRGTYYSKTMGQKKVTNVVVRTDQVTGAVTGVTRRVKTLRWDEDAAWRNLPEAGAEASFKAFGELYRGPTGIEEDRDLRHVFEPYADYTWRAEPNVEPEELWPFDSVDQLDKEHSVKLGLRNYLQTRRTNETHNLIYLDTFAMFDVEPEEDEDTLRSLNARTELKPWSWLSWNFDVRYTTLAGEIDLFNTQVEINEGDAFTFSGSYRYQLDKREQVTADLMILPEQRWSGRVYARVDLMDDHLDEHAYYLVHRTRCLGIGLGVRIRPDYGAEKEDDYTVWFRIWPLAFPEMMGDIGGS